MAFDEILASRLRGLFEGNLDISEKKMFGGLAFMCRGYMFVGIVGDELMARVGPTHYLDALKKTHVRKMDFTGKPMTGYVFVAAAGIRDEPSLVKWVSRSLQFIDTLPPKKTQP